jgi:hypothetical protein
MSHSHIFKQKPSFKVDNYKPLNETVKFFLWFKEFAREENKTPKIHLIMVDNMYKFSRSKTKVYECFRGSAKSTIITIWNTIYFAYKGYKPSVIVDNGKEKNLMTKSRLMYIVSSTIDLAKAHIDRIAHIIKTNDKIASILEIDKLNLSDYPMVIIKNKLSGEKMIVEGKAPNQKTRGKSTKGLRVDIIICDDLEDEENVSNTLQRDRLFKFINRVLLPMRNPNTGELHYIQTPINPYSPLFSYKRRYPDESVYIPVCANFKPNKQIPDEDLAWHDRFTSDYIQNMYEDMKGDDEKAFFQEFLLQVRDVEDMPLNPDKIKHIEYSELNIDEMNFYLIVDFSSSAKKSSDYYAYVCVGIDNKGKWCIIYVERSKYIFNEGVNQVIHLLKTLPKNTALVTEKGLLWNIAKDIIIDEADREGLSFEIFEVAKNMQSKHSLILSLTHVIDRLYECVPPECEESLEDLKEEMSLITASDILAKNDDLIDALATLMLVNEATVVTIGESYDSDADEEEGELEKFSPYGY